MVVDWVLVFLWRFLVVARQMRWSALAILSCLYFQGRDGDERSGKGLKEGRQKMSVVWCLTGETQGGNNRKQRNVPARPCKHVKNPRERRSLAKNIRWRPNMLHHKRPRKSISQQSILSLRRSLNIPADRSSSPHSKTAGQESSQQRTQNRAHDAHTRILLRLVRSSNAQLWHRRQTVC